jgi:hypothetical protein
MSRYLERASIARTLKAETTATSPRWKEDNHLYGLADGTALRATAVSATGRTDGAPDAMA